MKVDNPAPKLDRVLCAHCSSSGSCHSGKDASSCAVCIKDAGFKDDAPRYGLVCSVCDGSGVAEPPMDGVQAIGVVIALSLSFAAMFLVWKSLDSKESLDNILPFAAGVIGSITGFFFGSRGAKAR